MSRDFAIDPVSYVFDNVELAGLYLTRVLYLSQFNSVALTILQERQSRILHNNLDTSKFAISQIWQLCVASYNNSSGRFGRTGLCDRSGKLRL